MNMLGNVELLKKTYDGLLNDVAREYNLTINEIKILLFLNCNSRDIAKNIVNGLGSTKSHVSMSLCNLEKEGYIKRFESENNKKEICIELTDKSHEVIESGSKVQDKVKNILLKDITEDEIEYLINISKKMKNNLKDYIDRKDSLYD